MQSIHATIKGRQRALRAGFSESLGLRVHRAISWFGRAAQEESDDHDARFIFLWIAFNAAYAHEFPARLAHSESGVFLQFLEKLIDLDHAKGLYDLLWQKYPSSVRLILDNKYVYQPFWDHHAGLDQGFNWEDRFNRSKQLAHAAIGRGDTLQVLRLVLDRLYVLRNQLVHGGATWHSQTNRTQVRDCTDFMAAFIPILIELMMDHPEQIWGMPSYPVVR